LGTSFGFLSSRRTSANETFKMAFTWMLRGVDLEG